MLIIKKWNFSQQKKSLKNPMNPLTFKNLANSRIRVQFAPRDFPNGWDYRTKNCLKKF